MILILSTHLLDKSTEDVMDWLDLLEASYLRLNGEDLMEADFTISLATKSSISDRCLESSIYVEKQKLNNHEISSVWYRRWTPPELVTDHHRTDSIYYQLTNHLYAEYHALGKAFFSSLSHCHWLNKPQDLTIGKVRMLELAAKVGIDIPATIICTTKERVLQFLDTHQKVITKCIGDTLFFNDKSRQFGNYTAEVNLNDIVPDEQTFFPSLLQEEIKKKYELRIFFIDGVFYPMSIFSQSDQQTKVDFREYNDIVPNRVVPYKLPKLVESQLLELMTLLDLNCGSIDMIKDISGKYIFLEVNPVGQFEMVSLPCNYYLEKKIATYLLCHSTKTHA